MISYDLLMYVCTSYIQTPSPASTLLIREARIACVLLTAVLPKMNTVPEYSEVAKLLNMLKKAGKYHCYFTEQGRLSLEASVTYSGTEACNGRVPFKYRVLCPEPRDSYGPKNKIILSGNSCQVFNSSMNSYAPIIICIFSDGIVMSTNRLREHFGYI